MFRLSFDLPLPPPLLYFDHYMADYDVEKTWEIAKNTRVDNETSRSARSLFSLSQWVIATDFTTRQKRYRIYLAVSKIRIGESVMKPAMHSCSFFAAALLAVLVAGSNPAFADRQKLRFGYDKPPGHSSFRLNGSYDASIDFFGNPIRALYSFHAGGTVTESDNPGFDPNFGGYALSPGLGSWERTGKNEYSAVYRKLAYDTDGFLQEVYTTTMALAKEHDGSLSGTISVSIALPDGTIVGELAELPLTAAPLMVR